MRSLTEYTTGHYGLPRPKNLPVPLTEPEETLYRALESLAAAHPHMVHWATVDANGILTFHSSKLGIGRNTP